MTTKTKLNVAQESERARCEHYEDRVLTKVEEHDDGYTLCADGTCWGLPAEYGVEPKIGDTIRTYGRFGYSIEGQDLNGEPIYYKTEAERKRDHAQFVLDLETKYAKRFEKIRDKLDADYEALPEPFKRRLDRFRAEQPDFRWNGEPYESFILVEAAKIAETLSLKEIQRIRQINDYKKRAKAERAVPGLVENLAIEQHSGNTWGAAWYMAEALLSSEEV